MNTIDEDEAIAARIGQVARNFILYYRGIKLISSYRFCQMNRQPCRSSSMKGMVWEARRFGDDEDDESINDNFKSEPPNVSSISTGG